MQYVSPYKQKKNDGYGCGMVFGINSVSKIVRGVNPATIVMVTEIQLGNIYLSRQLLPSYWQ